MLLEVAVVVAVAAAAVAVVVVVDDVASLCMDWAVAR